MLSRNRSMCGVRPYVRASCNPDADSWVASFLSWWIDQDTGYAIPERSGKIQNMHFYRFTEGKFGYPTMIELFSRKPGYHLNIEEGIIPIHIDDDTSSLSAILLNDDFYKFMMSGRRVVDGIGVLGAEHLIPFKMYAWINLLDRKRAGEHVNEKDLKKHKYDVFRLLQIVTTGIKVESEGLVTECIHRYIEEISAVDESEIRLLQMGMPFDSDRGVELLKEIYL